jgi:hypothetical protein
MSHDPLKPRLESPQASGRPKEAQRLRPDGLLWYYKPENNS